MRQRRGEAAEQRYGAFTDDVRRLLDLTIRSTVDEDRMTRAQALIREAADLLAEEVSPGPAGVRYNGEGRSWNWGNAVIGVRNAVAPPVALQWGEDGSVSAEVTLGAAYEGPPGQVHGGVAAMLLEVRKRVPVGRLAGHFHDTGGRAIANIDAALALENREFLLLFDTADKTEGMRAFLDKRKPDFKGQ